MIGVSSSFPAQHICCRCCGQLLACKLVDVWRCGGNWALGETDVGAAARDVQEAHRQYAAGDSECTSGSDAGPVEEVERASDHEDCAQFVERIGPDSPTNTAPQS